MNSYSSHKYLDISSNRDDHYSSYQRSSTSNATDDILLQNMGRSLTPEATNVETIPFLRQPRRSFLQTLKDRGSFKSTLSPVYSYNGWRPVVYFGCAIIGLVLLCNVALLAWASTKSYNDSRTGRVLYQGDCSETKSLSIRWHLAINVLSTVMLSTSNYAMQVLLAPTRNSIDKAHAANRSLDIGISGLRNWRYIGTKHRILYASLFMTSIPLHLIFNSVIYSTIGVYQAPMFLVTSDFLQSPQPTTSCSSSLGYEERCTAWQRASSGTLEKLNKEDCYSRFSAKFVTDYRSVIVVARETTADFQSNITWLGETSLRISANSHDSNDWFCGSAFDLDHCKVDQNGAKNWTISFLMPQDTRTAIAHVQYCLADAIEPACTLELLPSLLYVVIVCNILKVAILISLLWLRHKPILTVGDAIASFLETPDPMTRDWGAVSVDQVRRFSEEQKLQDRTNVRNLQEINKWAWVARKHKYFSGASLVRWTLTLLTCLTYWMIGLGLLIVSMTSDIVVSFQNQWNDGIGNVNPVMSTARGWNTNLITNILVANAPQLILSIVYVSYNALFTCMLVSKEWTSYAHKSKGLRVTEPKGEQRMTYFLSLPYRFTIPLIAASVLLHWMLSQSIFVIQIYILNTITYATEGTIIVNKGSETIHAVGWSSLALLILLMIGGVLILALILFGFRKYSPGMPLVRSDSRAISAACHPLTSSIADTRFQDIATGTDGSMVNTTAFGNLETGVIREAPESTKRLQYGVMGRVDRSDGLDEATTYYHVGFSSGIVTPLFVGKHYTRLQVPPKKRLIPPGLFNIWTQRRID